jgi:hypothetical protein
MTEATGGSWEKARYVSHSREVGRRPPRSSLAGSHVKPGGDRNCASGKRVKDDCSAGFHVRRPLARVVFRNRKETQRGGEGGNAQRRTQRYCHLLAGFRGV